MKKIERKYIPRVSVYSIIPHDMYGEITEENIAHKFDELFNDGNFYKYAASVRKNTAIHVASRTIFKRGIYEQLMGAFARKVTKFDKNVNKTQGLIIGKLFLDYYLDELELGNLIY